MRLTNNLKARISEHAWAEYPKECCGLIVQSLQSGEVCYHPTPNASPDPHNSFAIDPQVHIDIAQDHDVLAIVHSHPNGEPMPSEIDRVQMGLHDTDWVIVGLGISPTGAKYCDIKRHKPKAYQSPLIGREYHHGMQDCYTLVQDYYSRELDIDLPDFYRKDDWWEDPNHAPLYEQNFAKAGFHQVHDLQSNDVILCRVGRTYHTNHALIYLGNHTLSSEQASALIGDSLVLHHPCQ